MVSDGLGGSHDGGTCKEGDHTISSYVNGIGALYIATREPQSGMDAGPVRRLLQWP